ncbi:cytosine permease [Saccharopolyspora sp. K220]|uniref:cytosine permease n=1 Tax=Saccharopolyspora soli TaxID=2926618 RepID=UPI001F5A55D4|nr:cytosine permease [Saccharopolyspora soli]MCI2422320.1 cytosine permease [Saccharopolyspora soli]
MTAQVDQELFESEYENEPVPIAKRRSLFSVTSVWAGFPMIITGAVTGATLVTGMGFAAGAAAMVIGNLLLFGYVGLLSALAASRGENFSLQAARTFGSRGYVVCSALLSTLVLGWFAVQTGLVGDSVASSFDVDITLVTIVAGVLFTAITLLGIRALSIIGLISVPLFLVLGVYAVVQAMAGGGAVWSYPGDPAVDPLSLGAGVTLVFALFADSGTMTADFTRWSKNPKEAVIATASAFPVSNLIAMLIGGSIAAATLGGDADVFGLIVGKGGIFTVLAVILLFVNLGSVCTHCLYNGAVGWSTILNAKMRVLTLVMGVVGIVIASLGIWSYFIDWLNLLGVVVPPIGAIMVVDQLLRRRATGPMPAVRYQPFVAWAAGSGVALIVNFQAPWFSTVVVAIAVSAVGYALLVGAGRDEASADVVVASDPEPVSSAEKDNS